jgi:hypothetical protein
MCQNAEGVRKKLVIGDKVVHVFCIYIHSFFFLSIGYVLLISDRWGMCFLIQISEKMSAYFYILRSWGFCHTTNALFQMSSTKKVSKGDQRIIRTQNL